MNQDLKNFYLSEIYMRISEICNDNIQTTRELFKYYGIDLDKEISNENGNILCVDCENCYNCVYCEACVNCKNCWCLLDVQNVENEFSDINNMKHMRDEPLTEEDKKDLQKGIDIIDDHFKVIFKIC